MTEEVNPVIEEVKEQAEIVRTTKVHDPEIVPQDEKILSMIGYFSFFCVLPLILRQDSEYCQFHGKQSLALSLLFIAVWMCSFLVGWLFSGIYVLVSLANVGLAIYGIYTSSQGKMTPIPGLDRITKYFVW